MNSINYFNNFISLGLIHVHWTVGAFKNQFPLYKFQSWVIEPAYTVVNGDSYQV